MDELIGFLKGIVADAVVTDGESRRLAEWLLENDEFAHGWPLNVLVARLNAIFADGHASTEEREDLRCLIEDIVGRCGSDGYESESTRLPLTKPAPEVIFDQNIFVFTGRFCYGTRRNCEREVTERGGRCSDNITLQTSYLVLGELGSRDWIHSCYGRKIETAVKYTELLTERHGVSSLSIVSEEHWQSFLCPAAFGASM
jgi:NAD-dependent DNA ligase